MQNGQHNMNHLIEGVVLVQEKGHSGNGARLICIAITSALSEQRSLIKLTSLHTLHYEHPLLFMKMARYVKSYLAQLCRCKKQLIDT